MSRIGQGEYTKNSKIRFSPGESNHQYHKNKKGSSAMITEKEINTPMQSIQEEIPENISNIYHRMNTILEDIRYKSYQSHTSYYLFFFVEFILHGKNQGAYNLFWCRGSVYDRIMTVRFDFSAEYKKYEKDQFDRELLFDYALIGIVDFLYDAFTNQMPYETSIQDYNIIPVFILESDLYRKMKKNRSIYAKPTLMIHDFGKGYHIGSNSLLHDLYTTKKFDIRELKLYSSTVWSRGAIYKIREETALISIKGSCDPYDADITLHHYEDLLGGRKIGVFTGPFKDRIQSILDAMYRKGKNPL